MRDMLIGIPFDYLFSNLNVRLQGTITFYNELMNNKISHMKIIFALFIFGLVVIISNGSQDEKNDDEWYKSLPVCPCTNPDMSGVKINDGWAKDKGNISKYHKGATECFRSYPYVKTSTGNSCQQCCYDDGGLLIKVGSGAGTPDKVSTCAGEDTEGIMTSRFLALISHYYKDVKPWEKAGSPNDAWKTYNKYWVPNQGDCSTSK